MLRCLLVMHGESDRTLFTNHQLRLAVILNIPSLGDSLESRLLTLSKRLAEQVAPVRLEKSKRGLCERAGRATHVATEEREGERGQGRHAILQNRVANVGSLRGE